MRRRVIMGWAALACATLGCEEKQRPPDAESTAVVPEAESTAVVPEAESMAVGGLFLPLAPMPGQTSQGDVALDRLHYLLKANVIVTGKIEREPGGALGLRVSRMLRGNAAELRRIDSNSQVTGCEGVPDFESQIGREVCLFLTKSSGALSLLHGAAGMQRLPYGHGGEDTPHLTVDELAILANRKSIPPAKLAELVRAQGPGLLDMLSIELNGAIGETAPAVQAELKRYAEAFPDKPRHDDVVSLTRHYKPEPAWRPPDAALAAMKHYEATLRTPSLAASQARMPLLTFMLPFDAAWVAEAFVATPEASRRGQAYEALRKQLRSRGALPR